MNSGNDIFLNRGVVPSMGFCIAFLAIKPVMHENNSHVKTNLHQRCLKEMIKGIIHIPNSVIN